MECAQPCLPRQPPPRISAGSLSDLSRRLAILRCTLCSQDTACGKSPLIWPAPVPGGCLILFCGAVLSCSQGYRVAHASLPLREDSRAAPWGHSEPCAAGNTPHTAHALVQLCCDLPTLWVCCRLGQVRGLPRGVCASSCRLALGLHPVLALRAAGRLSASIRCGRSALLAGSGHPSGCPTREGFCTPLRHHLSGVAHSLLGLIGPGLNQFVASLRSAHAPPSTGLRILI
jgi:hypothetical protein